MSSYAPAPIGAVVRYHGSKTSAHGEYVVFGVCACRYECAAVAVGVKAGRLTVDAVRDVRYELGVIDQHDGGPNGVIVHVRASSFTVLRDAEDTSVC